MEDELIIRTEGLSRHFKKKPSSGGKRRLFQKSEILKAVEDVSIEVKRGEIFGLIGPNGAGKTTLIKMLSTLILPTSGRAWVNGFDVLKEDEKVRSSLGLLIEVERSFYYRLSGWQNLYFFAMLYNLGKKDAEARIKDVLKLVKLDDKANEKYMTYSTGQKHRLGIARSILHEPAVLIYDEPTSSLDPASAHYIRGLIKDLKEGGKTVFLSTHNMQEAEELCNRLAVMHKGQIVKVGTPQELRRSIGGEGVTLEDVFMKLTGESWRE